MSHTQPIVIVAGLRGHVEEHWQTHLVKALPGVHTVDSTHRDKRDLGGRIADVEAVVSSLDAPATIVAHSAGVLVTVHWAMRHGRGVAGAILATPPDLGRPLPSAYPTLAELEETGWLPIPRQPLPFPSIVGASTNDDLGDPIRVRALATSWGSRVIDLGPVGHLNPASGYGEWPGVFDMIARLDRSVAAH